MIPRDNRILWRWLLFLFVAISSIQGTGAEFSEGSHPSSLGKVQQWQSQQFGYTPQALGAGIEVSSSSRTHTVSSTPGTNTETIEVAELPNDGIIWHDYLALWITMICLFGCAILMTCFMCLGVMRDDNKKATTRGPASSSLSQDSQNLQMQADSDDDEESTHSRASAASGTLSSQI